MVSKTNTKGPKSKKQPQGSVQKQAQKDLRQKKAEVKKQGREVKNKASSADFRFGRISRTKAKNAIQTLPYVAMHEGDVLELPNGRYSKTYSFSDINYIAAKEEDRLNVFSEYCKLLNSFSPDMIAQIVVVNKAIPNDEVHEGVLGGLKGDYKDPITGTDLGEEFAQVIRGYLDEGVNNQVRSNYVSVSIEADNAEGARRKFINIETLLRRKFKDISKDCALVEMRNADRAAVLAELLRQIPNVDFSGANFSRKEEKGYIAPSHFHFSDDHITMGGRLAKCMFLRDISSEMSDELISALLSSNIEQVISLNLKPVDMVKARNKILQKQTIFREQQLRSQMRASRQGVLMDITPRPILDAQEAADEFHDAVRTKKQNILLFSMVIMFFANSPEELRMNEETLQSKAGEFLCRLEGLSFQQERGLQSCLPIGFYNLSIRRSLPTEAAGIFLPFDRLNTIQRGGLFYSLHADTKQAIVLDHSRRKSSNGFILGSSGSGKGMFFKQLILNILFLTNDDIIIVDPENENWRFVRAFGGQSLELSTLSKEYVNPFDISPEDKELLDGHSPAELKVDLILSIIEAMLGSGVEFNPAMNGVVDNVLNKIYKNFAINRAVRDLPTFKEFYDALGEEYSPIGKELQDIMRIYVTGSWSNFSNRTNVNISNRFVCYNTSRLGDRLKPVGSFLMFDAIWNRLAQNRNTGKSTWIFIDEAHLVFNSEESIKRVGNMYRRFRKYDGKIISMTQNTSDVLRWVEARSMIANADFIAVLNQKETERREIAALLNLPPAMVSHITNSGKGEGLLFSENMLIPFSALFPKNTRLYELMTTDSGELAQILAKEDAILGKA